MDKKIIKIIENSKQPYDKVCQQAELIRRNPKFIEEFQGISKRFGEKFFIVKNLPSSKISKKSKDNVLIQLDYPKVIFEEELEIDLGEREFLLYMGEYEGNLPYREKDPYFRNYYHLDVVYVKQLPVNLKTQINSEIEVLSQYKEKWEKFCKKWNISPDWNGDEDNLSKFFKSHIDIGVSDENSPLPIYIRCNSWTTLDEIKKKWSEVTEIQESLHKKEKKSPNFGRDIAWYDLYKMEKNPKEIAELWIKHRPDHIANELDIEIVKRVIKRDKSLKGVDPNGLLEEIRSDDPNIDELKKEFDEEKKMYLTGVSKYGRFKAPFIDLIKKSIENIKDKIGTQPS